MSPFPLDGSAWVVAQRVPARTIDGKNGRLRVPAMWSVQRFLEQSDMQVGGTGGTTESWPSFFDSLPDRSPPAWWPVPVPSAEVAAEIALVLVVLIALTVLVAFVRGIRFALTRGARRLGRSRTQRPVVGR